MRFVTYFMSGCISQIKFSNSFYIFCLNHTGENCPLTFAEQLSFIRINIHRAKLHQRKMAIVHEVYMIWYIESVQVLPFPFISFTVFEMIHEHWWTMVMAGFTSIATEAMAVNIPVWSRLLDAFATRCGRFSDLLFFAAVCLVPCPEMTTHQFSELHCVALRDWVIIHGSCMS